MTSVQCLWITSCEENRLSPHVGVTRLSTWPQFAAPQAGVIDYILPENDRTGWVTNSSNHPEPFEIELICGSHVVARSDVIPQLAAIDTPGFCLGCDTMDVHGSDPDAPIEIYIPASGVYLAKSTKNESLHHIDAAGCSDLSLGQA